jgi:transcriptional regulator NrdR family protein
VTVVKSDGTREEYFHTKVVGTIANAFGATGQADIAVAEELAEAVTFFIHHSGERRNISSGEIFSIIETALAGTSYVQEAIALSERHFERKLKRSRLEVVKKKQDTPSTIRSRWDKSRIIEDLVKKQQLDRQTARAIASMVEEKVFSMGLSVVPAGLIEHLVINDADVVLNAQQQLQTV